MTRVESDWELLTAAQGRALVEELPYAPPMRLLTCCLAIADTRARCCATISRDCPLVPEGRTQISSWVVLEYFAQTAALLLGYRSSCAGQPLRGGLLLSVRDAEFVEPTCALPLELELEVELGWFAGRDARFSCSARRVAVDQAGQDWARATISVRSGALDEVGRLAAP